MVDQRHRRPTTILNFQVCSELNRNLGPEGLRVHFWGGVVVVSVEDPWSCGQWFWACCGRYFNCIAHERTVGATIHVAPSWMRWANLLQLMTQLQEVHHGPRMKIQEVQQSVKKYPDLDDARRYWSTVTNLSQRDYEKHCFFRSHDLLELCSLLSLSDNKTHTLSRLHTHLSCWRTKVL